jgi:D-alanine-D-alanine ligase
MKVNKHKIAILTGGRSTEYDASVMSYENVIDACRDKDSEIEISAVYFIKDGFLYIYDEYIPSNHNELGAGGLKYPITDLPGIIQKRGLYILNLLHGNEGEDGSYQGVAQVFDLAGSFGCVLSSALTMNKWQASELVAAITNGKLALIPYLCLTKETTSLEIDQFIDNTSGDYFVVKPNSLGASLLTRKIKRGNVLNYILSERSIFDYDGTFLLQKYIQGREFTVGIVQKGDELIVLPIIEAITADTFLGHEEKHNPGHIKALTGEVGGNLRHLIESTCKDVFKKLGISNFCRFDLLYLDNKLYFLEANTIPGLMKQSSFTHMLSEKKITIPNLIGWFIENNKNEAKVLKDFRYQINSDQ